MTEILVIGVPLPILPEGLEWKTLGSWIELRSAGTLPELGPGAYLDQTGRLRPPDQTTPGNSNSEGQEL
jgi:hypothetical protein